MIFFNRLPLRYKYISSMLLICVVSVLLSTIAFVQYNKHKSIERVTNDARILAQIVASRSTAALVFADTQQAQANLKALGANTNILMACIYDSSNDVFAAYHFDSIDQRFCPDIENKAGLINGQKQLHIFEDISLDGLKIGTLYILMDTTWLEHIRNQQYLFAGLIIIACLIITLIIAQYLQRLLSASLARVSKTARAITSSRDFSLRARKESFDEVGEMVDVFNNMLSNIESESRSLKASEEKFRQLSALSPVGIFQIDLQENLTYINDRWCEITGIGQGSADLTTWLNSARSADRRALYKAWRGLTTRQESFVIEAGFIKGEMITYAIIEAGALHDADGNVCGFMGAVSDITDLKNAQIQMENLAYYDPLTGLANRRLFRSRLDKSLLQARRDGSSLALLFLDLDQFKRINDSMGHDAGDQLLIETARRISECVRETDTVSRIGGDEFTVLLGDISSSHEVHNVADKILRTLAQPLTIKNQELTNTVSIGITMGPADGLDGNSLMRNADMAMYRAKEMGRNNYQFFSQEMNTEIMAYLGMEKDLRRAIDEREFVVYYQPKIDLLNGRIMGAEALLRWRSQSGELIAPDRFIPIAEDSGLIIPIGEQALLQACHAVKKLIDKSLWPRYSKIAVNLSAKQFADRELVNTVEKALLVSGLPVENLELEITESTLMDNVEHAITTMRAFQERGISIAIDDFGTGYSSLSYLKRFPINVLKVDRSFVMDIPRDINDMEITGAVIAMAHKLNLQVVAEGVETPAQLQFLRANNCEYAQGYLFSKPLPIADFEAYISKPLELPLAPQ
ncbi:MAG: EAL domain-containing protein [Oceanospirillaceae bacterium]|nr:EAL domain-containing protein [Oceanospirillaceae bacterium]MCP5350392.1 EAL domain-containing protein [Oceanospirillaceae bacterium]